MFIRKWMGNRWLTFLMEGHEHRFMWNMEQELIVKLPATLPDEQTYLQLEFLGSGLEGAIESANEWLELLARDVQTHFECDACGEMKLEEGGELDTGGPVRKDQIDPPDVSWICAECVARRDDAMVDVWERRQDNAALLYYEEK